MTIEVAPNNALYGRKCQTLVCSEEVGNIRLIEPRLVQTTMNKETIIKNMMKIIQDRQKSYANNLKRSLKF